MGQTYALPSDVWSTGITFVEVEQGHPPFQIETEFKLVREIFQTVGGRVKNLELCTKLVNPPANGAKHPAKREVARINMDTNLQFLHRCAWAGRPFKIRIAWSNSLRCLCDKLRTV